MIVTILDSNGSAQSVITKSQEAIVDASGSINTTNTAQNIVSANAARSGFVMQNTGQNDMYVSDVGAADAGVTSFLVPPGAMWPPADYPVSTGAISIYGTATDTFVAREW